MNWLPDIDKEQQAALDRPVSSTEAAEYRRRTGLSRWSLGVTMSPADSVAVAVTWIACCAGLAVAMSMMLHWLTFVSVVAGAVLILLLVMLRASDRSVRRHVRMNDFASRCGLYYDPIGAIDTIGSGLIFDIGHSRRYRGVLSYGEEGRRLLEMGRYQYTLGSGKQQRTYTWWYMGVRLPRKVPHMILDATQNDAKLMSKGIWSNLPVVLRGSQRISLEGDFNNHFTLYAPKQYDVDARYVLTPDVMAALIDVSSTFDVELVDDMAFFYTPLSNSSDAQVMRDMLTVLKVVGRELHDQTDGYADDRVTDARRTNAVAEQGRRLKKWKVPGV